MLFLFTFSIILILIGAELVREGVIKNTQFKPRYTTNEGNKLIIVGTFLVLAGFAGLLSAVFI